MFGRSYLSVDLFFMLSGYVIARTYEQKFDQGLKFARFSIIRLRRLWPTMVVGALLGLGAFWGDLQLPVTIILFVMGLMFIPLFADGMPGFPQNPPAWSIVFEIFANLLHALFLKRLGITALAALAAACIAILVAFAKDGNVGALGADFELGFPRVLAGYSMGILLWRVLGDAPRLPIWIGPLLLVLPIVAASHYLSDFPQFDFLFAFVLCPVIVISGITAPRYGGRWFALLGSISFPLYAVHYPIEVIVTRHGGGPILAVAATIPAAWIVAKLLAPKPRSPNPQDPRNAEMPE